MKTNFNSYVEKKLLGKGGEGEAILVERNYDKVTRYKDISQCV
jgi:hypothetical protein